MLKTVRKLILPLLVLLLGGGAAWWVGHAFSHDNGQLTQFLRFPGGSLPPQIVLWGGIALVTTMLMITVAPWWTRRAWPQRMCLLLLCAAIACTTLYPPDDYLQYSWVLSTNRYISWYNSDAIIKSLIVIGGCLLHAITFWRHWLRAWWYVALACLVLVPRLDQYAIMQTPEDHPFILWPGRLLILASIPIVVSVCQLSDYLKARRISTSGGMNRRQRIALTLGLLAMGVVSCLPRDAYGRFYASYLHHWGFDPWPQVMLGGVLALVTGVLLWSFSNHRQLPWQQFVLWCLCGLWVLTACYAPDDLLCFQSFFEPLRSFGYGYLFGLLVIEALVASCFWHALAYTDYWRRMTTHTILVLFVVIPLIPMILPVFNTTSDIHYSPLPFMLIAVMTIPARVFTCHFLETMRAKRSLSRP